MPTLVHKITILAGGWSASLFDLRKLPGTVIAVNDSAMYAPRWDILVSMDRLWAENRWRDVILKTRKPCWLRKSTLKNCEPIPAHVTQYVNDHQCVQLSDERGRLDGTHSGFCALNLAYQMRPKQLFLVGFDMARGPRDEAHWFPQYPWVAKHATGVKRLAEWADQFAIAARQLRDAGIDVRICGEHSAAQARKPNAWRRISRDSLEQACVA